MPEVLDAPTPVHPLLRERAASVLASLRKAHVFLGDVPQPPAEAATLSLSDALDAAHAEADALVERLSHRGRLS